MRQGENSPVDGTVFEQIVQVGMSSRSASDQFFIKRLKCSASFEKSVSSAAESHPKWQSGLRPIERQSGTGIGQLWQEGRLMLRGWP